MADPLSITASIFAVLQLTSVVTKYTQELRGASKESAKLLLELSSLRGILESLSDFASSDDAWIQSSKILIGGSDGSLARLNDDLEGLRSQLEPVVGLKKVKKSVTWPFKHEEIRKIFGRLERFKSLFMLAMETDHISLSREINNNVLDVKDKLADMQQQCNSSLRSDILKWLSPVDPSTNHIEACAKHETNTGGWLLDSDQYQSWLRQDGEVLWLHGIPGAGKSVMFSTLVEGVRVRCDKLANTGHAYFYFDFKEPAKQNVENLYRSLLTQFSAQQPSIPSAVMKIYDESRDSPGAMKLNDLSDALFTVLGDFDRAYILIDALDECDERPLLLRRLQELARNAGKHWSLLLTSRGEYDIETGLSGVVTHNFEIQTTDTQEDIRTLIRSRLRQDPQLKKRPSAVKKKIENALEEGACGMFRWVACQLDVLGSCLSPSVLDRTLKSLPRTLDETYERILLKVPEEYQQQAFSALQFLAFSLRPVSLDCIAEVIAFPPGCRDVDDMDRLFDSHDVLAICPSLITIQQNGNIAQLAHYSVKEWLMSPRTCRGPVKAFHLDFAKAHTELTNLCVDYVYLVHELRGVASLSQNFPLLAYAILQWSQHARLAENEGGTEQPALGTRLLSSMSSPVFNGWRRIYVNLETWDDQKPAFWSFAKRNPFERYTTPLSWAAFLDLPKTVQAFLDQGADVNDAVSSVYYTSLQAAAFHGRTHIVKILLDHGADINRKGTLGTALQSAFESRDPATINLLLERGADVNAQCGYYYSPLQFALAQSMPDFVPKLVSLGANVNLTGGHFGTALQAAAARGQEAAVDILIKHGANYITHCGLYGNPLQAASQAGHATVVHRLLDAGADPNAAGGRYRNAFHAALAMRVSSKNRKEILEMLVAAGARPPVDSLMIAIQGNMDANIIKIILDHDVTVVAQRHAIQSDAQLSQFDDDLRSSSMELYLLEPWFRPEEYDDFWKRYEHCLAEDVKNRLRLYDQRRREVELRHQHVSE